jgi:hypothetical protein
MFMKPNLARIVKIFLSCAEEDESFLRGLELQLSSLVREGHIESWHRYKLSPGSEWREQVKKYLAIADLILLLVSPDFVASDYYYGVETLHAMEQYETGKACVIPIILRPVEWEHLVFGKLQSLPIGKAVDFTPKGFWFPRR